MAVVVTRTTMRIVAKKCPGGATNVNARIANTNDRGAPFKKTMIRTRDRPPTLVRRWTRCRLAESERETTIGKVAKESPDVDTNVDTRIANGNDRGAPFEMTTRPRNFPPTPAIR
jgi:hypothetical protein